MTSSESADRQQQHTLAGQESRGEREPPFGAATEWLCRDQRGTLESLSAPAELLELSSLANEIPPHPTPFFFGFV